MVNVAVRNMNYKEHGALLEQLMELEEERIAVEMDDEEGKQEE